jgi:Ca2+-binding EF-hand superfamily protein
MEEVGGMAVVTGDKVENVVEMVVRGYSKLIQVATATPATDTLDFIESLKEYDDLDDPDLIDMLATWARLKYDDFKKIWDTLYDSEKNEVLRELEYRLAIVGFEELWRRWTSSFYVKENPDLMDKMINIAKKYVSGKIDFDDFADALKNVLWPTEKDREMDWREVDNYLSGMTLASYYIDEETIKEIVKKYLIDELGKLRALWIPWPKKSQVHKS